MPSGGITQKIAIECRIPSETVAEDVINEELVNVISSFYETILIGILTYLTSTRMVRLVYDNNIKQYMEEPAYLVLFFEILQIKHYGKQQN